MISRILPAVLCSSLLCAASGGAADPASGDMLVYFGCYTGEKTGSKGILVSRFDSSTGLLTEPVLAAEMASPSFLALHPLGKYLYAVGEAAAPGKKGGTVAAFEVNRADGSLKALNTRDSGGSGPCHISLDATGAMAMVANYGGGSVASYRIGSDGQLSEPASFIQHEGSSVNESRQKGPHAHSMNRSPDNRFAFACDLGTDKVLTYRMDPAAGTLTSSGAASPPAGSGPRHLAWHPSGRFAFVNNELTMTVSTFSLAAETGVLTLVDTVSTLPEADRGKTGFSTAETVAHPDGRTVYVSNRTHDTIAVFKCDPASGRLSLIQNAPAEGSIPRNFNLDPSGRWMIVAHQDSGTAAVFKVDPADGRLSFTGNKVKAGGAVCVKFLAAEK